MMRRRSPRRAAPAQRQPPRLPVVHETSAGGVVIRKIRGRWHVALLRIRHTRGLVWVLPKGHVEHHRGETRDVAAVREVKEELGIAHVRVLRKLGAVRWEFLGTRDRRAGNAKTAGTPDRRGRPEVRPDILVRKVVHHYLMEGLSERLAPQKSEGFLEARWVPYAQALKLLAYPTDRQVVAKVLEYKKQ